MVSKGGSTVKKEAKGQICLKFAKKGASQTFLLRVGLEVQMWIRGKISKKLCRDVILNRVSDELQTEEMRSASHGLPSCFYSGPLPDL